MELEEYVQMKDMFRSQREEAEREFELARAEEEEMSEINFKSTFFGTPCISLCISLTKQHFI